jgi:hypothetical protein
MHILHEIVRLLCTSSNMVIDKGLKLYQHPHERML